MRILLFRASENVMSGFCEDANIIFFSCPCTPRSVGNTVYLGLFAIWPFSLNSYPSTVRYELIASTYTLLSTISRSSVSSFHSILLIPGETYCSMKSINLSSSTSRRFRRWNKTLFHVQSLFISMCFRTSSRNVVYLWSSDDIFSASGNTFLTNSDASKSPTMFPRAIRSFKIRRRVSFWICMHFLLPHNILCISATAPILCCLPPTT